jgi:DNA-binding NarL/FixJ family response regulator
VVLAEDSVLLREGLTRLLEEDGHQVVAGVGRADQIAPALEKHRPDVLVTDVRMPPTNTDDGLRAAVAARKAHPGMGVLVLSHYVEAAYARELLADGEGSVGYLLKDRIDDLEALHLALAQIAAGGSVIDPEVIAQLLVTRRSKGGLDRLTPREGEVLALMAQGLTNLAIGDRLVLSPGAVEKHISAIFAKLDLPPSATDHRRVLAVLAFLHAL